MQHSGAQTLRQARMRCVCYVHCTCCDVTEERQLSAGVAAPVLLAFWFSFVRDDLIEC